MKLLSWIGLGLLFAKELALSVKEVALTVLRPSRPFSPAITAVPLTVKSEAGITLLANLITLTPGTTSLHVDRARGLLYIHTLNLAPDTVQQIKDGFERRVLKVLP